jgi:hypothetical protein
MIAFTLEHCGFSASTGVAVRSKATNGTNDTDTFFFTFPS